MGALKIFIFLAAVAIAIGAPSSSQVKASAKSVECGQTLYVTEEAIIEYKLGEAYNEYEACPWIVRFEGAANLQFDLQDAGLGEGKLTVSTLEAQRSYPYELSMSESVVLSSVQPATLLPGTVAVIVFSTLGTSGTGFALNITKVGESIVTVSPDSVAQIVSGNSGEIHHPAIAGDYSNNELSTFLFAPQNYTSDNFGFGVTRLQYAERDLESNCYDTVDVWSFDRVYNSWRHIQLICGGVETADFPHLQDLALVTFSTDSSGTGDGFSIQYERPYGVNNRKIK